MLLGAAARRRGAWGLVGAALGLGLPLCGAMSLVPRVAAGPAVTAATVAILAAAFLYRMTRTLGWGASVLWCACGAVALLVPELRGPVAVLVGVASLVVLPSLLDPHPKGGMGCGEMMVIVVIVWVLGAVMTPNFIRARSQGQVTACKSNLKNIGTALEMFSTDHGGRFPKSLAQLVPTYLRAIPTCPMVGSDTYSGAYVQGENPDTYFVACGGDNHGLGENRPWYNSTQGLIEDGHSGDAPSASPPSLPTAAPRRLEGVRVRQYFPEALYWNPLVITGADGTARVELPPADSITDWRVTAVANTEDGRVASTTAPLRVFQPFFVEPDVPGELTRGDSLEMPVAIYNYLGATQRVRVELQPDGWLAVDGPLHREVTLAANEVASVSFPLRAVRVGEQRLTLLARAGDVSDAVSRPVRVRPEGRPVEVVHAGRLSSRVAHRVEFPVEAVPGSRGLQVRVLPGVMSEVAEGLEGLLQEPHGCFEQTSSTTYPNVMVLQYLKETGRDVPEVRARAEQLILTGYQRLLSFEVDGGGFDWFGNPPAHKVLTAYGLMEFADMAKVVDVDDAVIRRTREWLERQQQADGSFGTDAHALESVRDGEGLVRTAYIAWAMLESGGRSAATDRAVQWLRAHEDEARDGYALALLANCYVLADRPTASPILSRLEAAVSRDGARAWWSCGTSAMYGSGDAGRMEATALAVQALMRAGRGSGLVQPGLDFLTSSRGSWGAWESTQATILSLRTLMAASRTRVAGRGTVEVRVNGKRHSVLAVDPESSDVLQVVDLGDASGEVELVAEGVSVAYQVVGRWNTTAPPGPADGGLGIDVRYDRQELSVRDLLGVDVHLRNRGAEAPMLLADVGVPPGFTVLTGDLDALVAAGRIARYEVAGRQVLLYLRGVRGGDAVDLRFRVKARFPLRARAGGSAVYEYYNPSRRAEQGGRDVIVR